MSAHQAPPSGLRRESPNTSYGGGGVGVEAGRRSPGQGLPAHAAGRGGVGAPGSTEQRFKVQTALVQEPAAAAVAPASTRVPEGAAPYAAIPTHTAGQPVVGRPIGGGDAQHELADRPSVAREAREMMPQTDPATHPSHVESLKHSADNTAGYDAGTASRGGGTGGTTEAMTGGVAAGGALGDERRAGMGDIARGQL